jgi:hypothetical protein
MGVQCRIGAQLSCREEVEAYIQRGPLQAFNVQRRGLLELYTLPSLSSAGSRSGWVRISLFVTVLLLFVQRTMPYAKRIIGE